MARAREEGEMNEQTERVLAILEWTDQGRGR